jgi:predicted flap endonuclease-1-like 5' DNA nuclease
MKALLRLALVAVAAKLAYEVIRRQRQGAPLPEGASYEPAPVPGRPRTDTSRIDDMTVIKGVGPVYADRLEAAAITTYAELADADAAHLSTAIDVSMDVVEGWQGQARELLG